MHASLRQVVVTGATGFLGKHVVGVLRKFGLHVIAPDRGRLLDGLEALVRDVAAGVEAGKTGIIHLAAAGVSPRAADWAELHAINVELPEQLVHIASTAGVAQLLMVGTAAEYGMTGDLHERVPPDALLQPVSSYGLSKVEGFRRSAKSAIRIGVGLHYVRVFNAYGRGQHKGSLWGALEAAAQAGDSLNLSSGTQVRDFIPAAVVARKVMAILHEPVDPGCVKVKNLGTGNGQTVRAFAEHWWGRLGATGSLRFGAAPDRTDEPKRLVADSRRVVEVRSSEGIS